MTLTIQEMSTIKANIRTITPMIAAKRFQIHDQRTPVPAVCDGTRGPAARRLLASMNSLTAFDDRNGRTPMP